MFDRRRKSVGPDEALALLRYLQEHEGKIIQDALDNDVRDAMEEE